METTIYHNPRCSKSRATLALLTDRGIEPRIVEYLETPPTQAELRELLAKLGLRARDLVRSKEPAFRASGIGLEAPEDELVRLMVRQPILMERPIVVVGASARIGRPPERVLELLE